jgi:hypothetical protein
MAQFQNEEQATTQRIVDEVMGHVEVVLADIQAKLAEYDRSDPGAMSEYLKWQSWQRLVRQTVELFRPDPESGFVVAQAQDLEAWLNHARWMWTTREVIRAHRRGAHHVESV